uniref:Uncharacterized protein n=1 Tax=Arundo donax TaxID=35708 RepID=A0A0A9HFW2_ARUDO
MIYVQSLSELQQLANRDVARGGC